MSLALTDETGPRGCRLLLVGEDDLSHGALARRLGASLARHGMDVTLRLVPEPGRIGARLVMPVRRLGAYDLQQLRWKVRYGLQARRLLRRDAGAADVVLVNTQSCALLSRQIMRTIPVVLSVDVTGRQFGSLEFWRPRSPGERLIELPVEALERRAYASARMVIAWTEWTARSLRDEYGVPPQRIRVLHFGVGVPAVPAPGPAAGTGGPLRVLFVGNAVERKGLATLLRARELAHADIDLHVVTGDPVDDGPGVTVHRELGAGSPELRELYATAHAFVLPTRADGVPWVVVEAMAAGLPVVAARVGAIPELLADTGMLVDPGDARGLAAALDTLAQDAGLRRALGARANRRARDCFDEAVQVPRLAGMLQEAAGAPC